MVPSIPLTSLTEFGLFRKERIVRGDAPSISFVAFVGILCENLKLSCPLGSSTKSIVVVDVEVIVICTRPALYTQRRSFSLHPPSCCCGCCALCLLTAAEGERRRQRRARAGGTSASSSRRLCCGSCNCFVAAAAASFRFFFRKGRP